MVNYFVGNHDHPQHLSVGAVLVDDKGQVCAHHFIDSQLKDYWAEQGISAFYLLMRKTMRPNETVEGVLAYGLEVEFGAKAEIVGYLGSLESLFIHHDVEVKKTTLYFLCKVIEVDESKRNKEEVEGITTLEWQTPDYLITKMKEQGQKYGRTDIDESEILEKAKTFIQNVRPNN